MQTDTSQIRKLAKARGFTTKFAKPNYSFFEGEALKFTGDAAGAKTFLLNIPGRSRGRPKGYSPKPNPVPGVCPQDYVNAKRSGGYVMKVQDGFIRLWAGPELVFESADVERLRLFFANARAGFVAVAPEFAAAREAKRLQAVEQARKADARIRAAEAKKLENAARRRGQKASGLRPDDPGIESEDFTPDNYQGLVLTWVALPSRVSGDAALIALWVQENMNPFEPAAAVRAKLSAARRALKHGGIAREIWLSDNDRASLARYRAEPSVVLTAAALAAGPARQVGRGQRAR